jgi:hypothetical protein
VGTALKLTSATAAGAEASHYLATTISPGVALQNKKHKVEFYMRPGSNFISNEWTVSVYSGSTRMVLSTDSSGVTYLPSATGKFTTTFDADSSSSYTLRFSRPVNAGTNAAVLNITNVIVGPGIQPQGAVVGPISNFASDPIPVAFGTVSGAIWKFQRIGSTARIYGKFQAGTRTGATASITLPTGYTIDTAALADTSSFKNRVGDWNASGGASPTIVTAKAQGVIISDAASPGSVFFCFAVSDTNGYSKDISTNVGGADNCYVMVDFTVPIAEWAGSGTVNLAQNDVEYASNSSTADASDTASFAYGPSGSLVPSTLTSARSKRVRFQTPIQPTDVISLQVQSSSGGPWTDFNGDQNQGVGTYSVQNASTYGIALRQNVVNSTDIDVYFGQYAEANGATFGAAGRNWSGPNGGGMRYRLVKAASGQAVGFGAATATSSGLVNTTDQTFAGVKTFNDGIKPSSGSSTLTTLETGGSWTPALDFVGGNGTASVSVALGRYIRINNMIMFSGMLSFAKGTASGTFRISGLPSNSSGVTYTGIAIHADTGVTLSSPRVCVQAYIASGGARIFPTFAMNNGTGAPGVDASDLAVGGSSFFFSGVYSVS